VRYCPRRSGHASHRILELVLADIRKPDVDDHRIAPAATERGHCSNRSRDPGLIVRVVTQQ
jgi:hypothetical protein